MRGSRLTPKGAVRLECHHATADQDRLAGQCRIENLFHRGVERIEITVQDRRPGHHSTVVEHAFGMSDVPWIALSAYRQ